MMCMHGRTDPSEDSKLSWQSRRAAENRRARVPVRSFGEVVDIMTFRHSSGANRLKFLKGAPILFHHASTARALRFGNGLPFGSRCGRFSEYSRIGPESETSNR